MQYFAIAFPFKHKAWTPSPHIGVLHLIRQRMEGCGDVNVFVDTLCKGRGKGEEGTRRQCILDTSCNRFVFRVMEFLVASNIQEKSSSNKIPLGKLITVFPPPKNDLSVISYLKCPAPLIFVFYSGT